jgi:hypothetical protein
MKSRPKIEKTFHNVSFGENGEGAMDLRLAGAGNAGQQFLRAATLRFAPHFAAATVIRLRRLRRGKGG